MEVEDLQGRMNVIGPHLKIQIIECKNFIRNQQSTQCREQVLKVEVHRKSKK